MAIRDKIKQNAQPYLEPGETIQAAFPATSGISPYLLAITYLLFFLVKNVVIVVTDRRILVLKASAMSATKPKEVLGTFPRETKLGPVSGIYAKINLGGTQYYVHRRFHDDVKAADAAAASAPAPA